MPRPELLGDLSPEPLLRATLEPWAGRASHIHQGGCPSEGAGFNTRDPECPACAALLANEAYIRELEAENERLREAHGLINEHADGWREKYHAARAELAQARADECDAIATYLEKLADLHDGPIGEHLALNDRAHALVARERANAHRSGTGAELAQRGDVVGWVVLRQRAKPGGGTISHTATELVYDSAEMAADWIDIIPSARQSQYRVAEVRALAGEGA